MEVGKKRLATLVGCNYQNTPNELHGCINDVLEMQAILLTRFGFKQEDITLLTDAAGSKLKPTGANILKTLGNMVDKAEAGDVLFFHYSGHGTCVPGVEAGHSRRKGEAIVPCDFNLITDGHFRHLVNKLPKGASFTMISDSCHSGGLIDKEKEQIGPSTINIATTAINNHKSKEVPYDVIMSHLSSLSGIDSPDVDHHLEALFGADANLSSRHHAAVLRSPKSDAGILLSGCQTNETSADACPEEGEDAGDESKAYGAFSHALQMVMVEKKGRMSNREIVTRARELLQEQEFEQHPCLYCSDNNADAPFLWQIEEEEEEQVVVMVAEEEEEVQIQKE